MTSAQNYILPDGTVDYASLFTVPPRVASHTDSDWRELQRISQTYWWRLRKNPDLLPVLWQDAKNGNSHARVFLSSATVTFILLDLTKFNSLQKSEEFLATPLVQAIVYEAMAKFMELTGKGYDSRHIRLLDFRLIAKQKTHSAIAKMFGVNIRFFYDLLKLKQLHSYHRLIRKDHRELTAELFAKFLGFRTRNRKYKPPLKSPYQNMAEALNYHLKSGSLPSVEVRVGLQYGIISQAQALSPLDAMIADEEKDTLAAVIDYGLNNYHTRELKILLSTYAGNSHKGAATEAGISRENARQSRLKMLELLKQWQADPEKMRKIFDYAGKAWQRQHQMLARLQKARESLQK